MNRIDPLPCIASFLAGAIIPIPGYLLLLVGWVPALQASLLLSSLVCLIAASAPWWADWLENRRIDAYFDSQEYRDEQLYHARESARGWTNTDLDA